MKKIVFLACAVLFFTACQQHKESKTTAGKAVAAADAPQIKFDQPIYDFGVIKEGEKVQNTFTFKNTGKSPLIITNATATCGCTQPEYPEAPVKPGETGTIRVTFDSTGKNGMQDKQITITSNASPEAEKLHLVGEVKEK